MAIIVNYYHNEWQDVAVVFIYNSSVSVALPESEESVTAAVISDSGDDSVDDESSIVTNDDIDDPSAAADGKELL